MEKKRDALDYYYEAGVLSPYRPEPYYRRGQIYCADRRSDLARTLFGRACLRGGMEGCRDFALLILAPERLESNYASGRSEHSPGPEEMRGQPVAGDWDPPPGPDQEELFFVGTSAVTRADFKRMRRLSDRLNELKKYYSIPSGAPLDLIQERLIVEQECSRRGCFVPPKKLARCALWPVLVPCIKGASPEYLKGELQFYSMRSALLARLFRKQVEWQVTDRQLANYFENAMYQFGQFRGSVEMVTIPVPKGARGVFERVHGFEREVREDPRMLKTARKRFPGARYEIKRNLISSRAGRTSSVRRVFHNAPPNAVRLEKVAGDFILIRTIDREPRWNFRTPAWQNSGRRLIREERMWELYEKWLERQRARYPVLPIRESARL